MLLRERNFRLLFIGQSVSLFGDGMLNVALPFAVLGIGGSASDVGLVFAARMVALVAFLLVGGVIADRMSRRSVMVASDLVRFVTHGAMGALLIFGGAEVWSLAALAAVGGAATGFFNPAATGLLPAVVRADQLQAANGMRVSARAAGELAGPALAGVLVITAGAGWALAIDAATFAVSAGFLSQLRLAREPAPEGNSFASDLREGWRAFVSRTWVWTTVAWAAFGNMIWGAWIVLGPVVSEDELGGAGAWGATLAAMGAGGLVGGLLGIRAEPRRPLVVTTLGWAILALPLAAMAASAGLALVITGAFAAGVGLMLSESIWESTIQRHIPADSISRVSAYDWFGSLAFKPVGLALWGPVAAGIGVSGALWLAFALQMAATIGLLAVPDVRRLRG